MTTYRYLGDRFTRADLRGSTCDAVRRADGKCVRGRLGTMLVRFAGGETCNVIGRLLRKVVSE